MAKKAKIKKLNILSIETSCDDTCISILEVTGGIRSANFRVLANNSNSQINIHRKYGGVYPVLAKREHAKNLPILLEKTLKEARIFPERDIDLIAVTSGPGLEMCLWEGITFAEGLAKKWSTNVQIPVIPVNHMEGHIFSPFAKDSGKFTIPPLKFPILSLLVSGGHTELVLSKKIMQYEIIGETVDDAVGEAFDKVARMLGLPYPGGPEISKLAEQTRKIVNQNLRGYFSPGTPGKNSSGQRKFSAENFRGNKSNIVSELITLPRPMLKSKDFNFSFSGLKTAVLYLIRDLGGIENINKQKKEVIALEFENAAVECLVYKTIKAIEKYKAKTLIIGGGVSGNKHLQKEIKKAFGKKVKIFFPTKELSTDNSIMIGVAGYLQYLKKKDKLSNNKNIKADGNLRLA